MANYENLMEIALKEAALSKGSGNKGYGAVLVRGDEIIARGHDTVAQTNDPTSHAEINVIRAAAKKLGPDLSGCTIVSTCEPCPMCSSAAVWANIERIVFGASIKETMALGRTRIDLPVVELNKIAPHQMEVIGGVLKDECLKLYNYKL